MMPYPPTINLFCFLFFLPDFLAAQWNTPITVDNNGNVGSLTSMTIVDGNPAISYLDVSNKDLLFVRATDASGSGWGIPITLDGTVIGGNSTSLIVANGNPAVSYSYFDGTGNNCHLRYIRATDASGSTWGTYLTLDAVGCAALSSSLAIVHGKPAISYYDYTNGNLKFIRASDPNGTAWGMPVTVATTGDIGNYPSLAVVNGNPAISFYDETNHILKYIRSPDTIGTAWGSPVTADATSYSGIGTSLTVVNGNPAIGYYQDISGDLKFVRANNVDGTTWGTPITVDAVGTTGQLPSMSVVNGNPAISYYNVSNYRLRYVRATDANGAVWSNPVTASITGSIAGEYSSLAVVDGNPAISYYSGNLEFVRAVNANGLPVELTSFYAILNPRNMSVSLNWQTASEMNNNGFEVERSTDGINWQTIHFENGIGTTTSPHNYSFLDEKPIEGQSFYRLQQIDFDGNRDYSNIISVSCPGWKGFFVSPNPVGLNGQFSIAFNNPIDEEMAHACLFNSSGQSLKTALFDSENEFSISVDGLPSSVYFLKITTKRGCIFEKIIVR